MNGRRLHRQTHGWECLCSALQQTLDMAMTWARFACAAEHAEDAGAGSAVAPAVVAAACHPAVTAVLPDPDCGLNPVAAVDTDQE